MKIGLTGSHGTGKTTLANVLAKKLEITLISEVARQKINQLEKYQTNYQDLKDWRADLFQSAILADQLLFESLYPDFLTDRTLIDIRAYCRQNTALNISIDADRYDYIVYVPIEFPLPQDDKQRYLDPDFQTQIDARILRLIKQFIPEEKIITASGSVDKRVEIILKKLKADGAI